MILIIMLMIKQVSGRIRKELTIHLEIDVK